MKLATFSGTEVVTIPLANISALSVGNRRPRGALFLALVFFALSLFFLLKSREHQDLGKTLFQILTGFGGLFSGLMLWVFFAGRKFQILIGTDGTGFGFRVRANSKVPLQKLIAFGDEAVARLNHYHSSGGESLISMDMNEYSDGLTLAD